MTHSFFSCECGWVGETNDAVKDTWKDFSSACPVCRGQVEMQWLQTIRLIKFIITSELSMPAAFIRVILETPNDPAPALVFADWLMENGQEAVAERIRNRFK